MPRTFSSPVTLHNNIRQEVLLMVRKFKSSWVELGRILYTVWKDKLYREWGFHKFETYVTQEVHIRKTTAQKLLRSYYFLEKEEPSYLQKAGDENGMATDSLPSCDAVDLLRQAKEKRLSREEYNRLKKAVFVEGKEASHVRKDLTALIRQREEISPEKVWEKKKEAVLKRFISTLKSIHRAAESDKLLDAVILGDINRLIQRLEDEL